MQQKSLALAAAVLAASIAAPAATPALADVEVTAYILKEKRVSIFESIDIQKDVDIDVQLHGAEIENTGVFLPQFLDGAAEALAVVNQRNTDNHIGLPGEEILDLDWYVDNQGFPNFVHNRRIRAGIFDSVYGNEGIVGVNQDSGFGNNQGNAVAVSFSDIDGIMVHAESGGEQVNTGNFSAQLENFPLELGNLQEPEPGLNLGAIVNNLAPTDNGFGFVDPTVFPDSVWHTIAKIAYSISQNTGVVGVNQSAGDGNNQMNMVSASIGASLFEEGAEGDPIALSEGALGQENSGNVVIAVNTWRKDVMDHSLMGNQGILGVNQTAGRFNNQANISSIAATQSSVSVVAGN